MSTETFKIRVGCVLPTVVKPDPKYTGQPPQCIVRKRDAFVASIESRMNLVHKAFQERTDSKVTILFRINVFGRHWPVRRITKTKGDRTYRIEHSWLKRVEELPRLQGAMVVAVWLPLESEFYGHLPCTKKAPYTKGNHLWFPCTENGEIGKEDPEAQSNEIKHWIKTKALECTAVQVPSPDSDLDFYKPLKKGLTPDVIRYLCKKYPPHPGWQ